MMNTTLHTCLHCGAAIPRGVPNGVCPACVLSLGFEPADVPSDPSGGPGPRVRYFGDYELLGEIARGGMGVVYRARQVTLRRVVALKMIGSGALASREDVVRFHTEAAAAARLDHPNIVPIHEIGEHAGEHYFSMKLVEGGSLADALRSGPFEPRAAAALLARVARAVHFAHQHGILHRDLKPANILLGIDGEPYVTDFGLARLAEGASTITRTRAALGTPAYMSPEQAAGAARDITTAADVYSLSAVLFEMLTGRPPFLGDSAVDVLRRLAETEPPRPGSLRAGLERDLEVICLKGLEKAPAGRYASALALAEDLERWLRHEPIEARPAGWRERAGKWIRRHPASAGLSAALGVAVLAGLLTVSWQLRKTRQALAAAEEAGRARQTALAPEIAASAVYKVPRAGKGTLLAAGTQRAVVCDPAGEVVAWSDDGGGRLAQFEGFTGHVARASLSADGRRLVTVAVRTNAFLDPVGRSGQTLYDPHVFPQPETLEVWEIAAGRRLCRLTATNQLGPTTVVALSPDGTRVLTGHQDGAAHLWDGETGRHLQALPGHASAVHWAEFSRDGGRLVTCPSGWRGSGLALQAVREPVLARVHDATDGREIAVLRNRHTALLPFLHRPGPDTAWATFSPDGRRLLVRARGSGNAGLWDADRGRLIARADHGDADVLAAAFSPDGRWFATAGADHAIRVWDAGTGARRWVLGGHRRPVVSLQFSPDSHRLLSGADDFDLRLWDVATGVGTAVLRGHEGRNLNAVFVSNGEALSVGDDGTVRRWTTATVEQLAGRLAGHAKGISGLVFTPDSRRLLSTSADATARLWDVAEGRELRAFTGWPGLAPALQEQVLGDLHDAAISPDGAWFVVNSDEWRAAVHRWRVPLGAARPLPYLPVRFWDLSSGELKRALDVGELGAEQIHLSPDGRRLAVLEGRIRRDGRFTSQGIRYQADFGPVTIGTPRRWTIHDTATGSVLGRTPAFSDLILPAAFTPDGRFLLIGHEGGITAFDGTTAVPVGAFSARVEGDAGFPGGGFVSFKPGPLGRRLVAHPGNASLATYDTTTWRRLALVPDLGDRVVESWLVKEESEVLTFTVGGRLVRHDAATGRELDRVGDLRKQLRFLALSPDERRLAVVQNERQVVLVDVETGAHVARLDGHLVPVVAVAFSPDGRWLASGDMEGVIRLWPLTVLPPGRGVVGRTAGTVAP